METLEAVVDLLTTVAVVVGLEVLELAQLQDLLEAQEYQTLFLVFSITGVAVEVPRATLTSAVTAVLAVAVEVLLAQLLVVLV
jgi:hypothetical protein